jgi:hypothetical protein
MSGLEADYSEEERAPAAAADRERRRQDGSTSKPSKHKISGKQTP